MNSDLLLALTSIDWLGIPRNATSSSTGIAGQQHEIRSAICLIISLILTLWLFARIQNRMRTPPKPHRPYRVFGRLLKRHGVRAGDRMMLFMLAICQRLKQPTLLLLSPALFARHADTWLTSSHVGSIWPHGRKRLLRVAQQVFNETNHVPPRPAD